MDLRSFTHRTCAFSLKHRNKKGIAYIPLGRNHKNTKLSYTESVVHLTQYCLIWLTAFWNLRQRKVLPNSCFRASLPGIFWILNMLSIIDPLYGHFYHCIGLWCYAVKHISYEPGNHHFKSNFSKSSLHESLSLSCRMGIKPLILVWCRNKDS